jgi:hypothetical protein
MGGLNLELMIKPIINTIVNRKPVQLYIYTGQTVGANGVVARNYAAVINTTAQVQHATPRMLEHINNIDITKIYKDFRIQSSTLTGLNRNINDSGDFIIMNSLYYKIVGFPENFDTGWVWVIGCESPGVDF